MCPQSAKAIRGGYKRKKENSINIYIYIYITRKILEAIEFVVWFIARVRQEGRLHFIRKYTMLRFSEQPCNIRNYNIVVLFFQYFKQFSLFLFTKARDFTTKESSTSAHILNLQRLLNIRISLPTTLTGSEKVS